MPTPSLNQTLPLLSVWSTAIKIELRSHTGALDTGHLAGTLDTTHLAGTPDWRHHLGHILGPGRAPCTGTLAPALGGGPGTLLAPDTGEPLQQLLHAGKVF